MNATAVGLGFSMKMIAGAGTKHQEVCISRKNWRRAVDTVSSRLEAMRQWQIGQYTLIRLAKKHKKDWPQDRTPAEFRKHSAVGKEKSILKQAERINAF